MPVELKRASWIELFYDLAYVALIAQLTYLVADYHSTPYDWLNSGIVAYAIFVAWWTTSVNRNMQDSETVSDKLLIQVKMVGAFLMSVTMPAVFVGAHVGFFMTLASVRFLQVIMLLRMYRLHPETAPMTYNIVQGLTVAGVLWVLSALIPNPYHYVVAIVALALDVLTPLSTGKGNVIRLLNVAHLKERLGLFLMLVMGESMIVVALSNTAVKLTFFEPLVMVSGLLFMITLWWLYFDHQDRTVEVRPRNFFVFLHAHAFLYISVVIVSVGYKFLLLTPRATEILWFIVIGMFGCALALTATRIALHGISRFVCVWMIVLGFLSSIVVALGYVYTITMETTVLLTMLFAAAAFFDQSTRVLKKAN